MPPHHHHAGASQHQAGERSLPGREMARVGIEDGQPDRPEHPDDVDGVRNQGILEAQAERERAERLGRSRALLRQVREDRGFENALLTCPASQIAFSGDQRTIGQWFNTSCFNRTSSQQLANNPITLSSLVSGMRGDGIRQLDLSLLKNTRLREGLNLEIRAEAYNAFNTPMFGPPSTSSPTSTAFGTVTAQFSTARTIQLAGKIVF